MEIKRKIELYVLGQLGDALLHAAKGGQAEGENAVTLEPPYGIVACEDAFQLVQDERTYRCAMTLTWVTHLDESETPEHAAQLAELQRRLGTMSEDGHESLVIHGFKITGSEQVEDRSRRSHADVLSFEIFCTG